LLAVGVIAPHKGQDLLVDALATLPDLDWSCTVVGALDVAPDFAARVRAAAGSPRIRFRGPLTGPDLAAAYAHADLLVLPSRAETYGMVIGDALARAIPVLATRVGGVPEALGAGDGSGRPGMLVAADDPAALAAALRDWLGDPARRQEWRRAAAARRSTLTGWPVTAERVSRTLLAAGR
jgi:glycosyltransferase involved in cell wall biosynthesis